MSYTLSFSPAAATVELAQSRNFSNRRPNSKCLDMRDHSNDLEFHSVMLSKHRDVVTPPHPGRHQVLLLPEPGPICCLPSKRPWLRNELLLSLWSVYVYHSGIIACAFDRSFDVGIAVHRERGIYIPAPAPLSFRVNGVVLISAAFT